MNIALVDDHLLLIQSLSQALYHTDASWDVKLFTKGEDFLAFDFEHWKPKIVILDLVMKGMDGIEMVEKVSPKLLSNDTKFIMLSSITDAATIKHAITKGIAGYLAKDSSLDELLDAISSALRNEQYIGHSLKDPLIKHMFIDNQLVFHLSPREKDVLNLICSGRTPKEIAYDLKLSLHTINQYHKNIMRKFNVNRTTDMVVFAMQNGLYRARVH